MRRCQKVVRWSWKYLPINVRVYVSREKFCVLYITRLHHVFAGVCRPFRAVGPESQKAEIVNTIWEKEVKRKAASELPGVRLHASTQGLLELLPNLAEFMTAATFESEGKVDRREAPTITIWCTGGQWKASIKDRAEGLVMWLSAESALELLQMADLFVLESSAPWRHDEGEQKGKRVKN